MITVTLEVGHSSDWETWGNVKLQTLPHVGEPITLNGVNYEVHSILHALKLPQDKKAPHRITLRVY